MTAANSLADAAAEIAVLQEFPLLRSLAEETADASPRPEQAAPETGPPPWGDLSLSEERWADLVGSHAAHPGTGRGRRTA